MLGDSAAAIRRALLELNARIREDNDRSQSPSTLLVYYSGHADADGLHPGHDGLSYRELKTLLRGSAASVRLLILDGCRSGGVTKVKGAKKAETFQIQAKSGEFAQGLVMISSSAAGEDSHESDALKGSFFSHHFVNGLLGAADEDSDGGVSLREAYAYAYRNTLRTSGRGIRLQHPTYSYELKGRDEVLMTQIRRSKTARIQLGEPGEYLIFRGSESGEIEAEVNVLKDGAVIAVAAGRYFIQLRKRDHYREFSVTAKRGNTVKVDTSAGRRVAYARLVRKGGQHQRNSSQVYTRVGFRSGLLREQTGSMGVVIGYQLDLPALSIGVRARFNQATELALNDSLGLQHRDGALGLAAQHYFDLEAASIGLGLITEVVVHRQDFTGSQNMSARSSVGFGLGALVTVERAIGQRLVLAVEGGPMSYMMRKARTSLGEENGAENETVLSGFLSLGVGYMF